MKPRSIRPAARLCLRLLRLGLALGCLSAAVLAQTSGGGTGSTTTGNRGVAITHTIRGKIFLPTNNLPEQRIRVVLEVTSGGIAAETFSDSVGNFEFRALPSNNYRVVVPTDNRTYETTQEQVEVFGNFARTFPVQIYLREKERDPRLNTGEKLLSPADIQEVPKNAKKAYEKGLKLARENKPADAAKSFQEALAALPDYLHALNKLGEQFAQMGKLTEAQAMFEKTIAANAKFALPHINLGMLLVNLKQYPEAIQALESGNRLDDSFPMSHLNLGVTLMSKEPADYERAEKELTRALEMSRGQMPQVRLYLFNLHSRRRDYHKAAAQLEAYLKEAPNAPDAEAVRQRLAALKKMLAQQAGGKPQ